MIVTHLRAMSGRWLLHFDRADFVAISPLVFHFIIIFQLLFEQLKTKLLLRRCRTFLRLFFLLLLLKQQFVFSEFIFLLSIQHLIRWPATNFFRFRLRLTNALIAADNFDCVAGHFSFTFLLLFYFFLFFEFLESNFDSCEFLLLGFWQNHIQLFWW